MGEEKATARLEMFSDGVFAIAITLLIIEVHVPEAEGAHELARALVDLWPSFFAFALSFVTILIMWLNHHAIFAWVERGDGALYVSNGVLLMTITALPFTTALLGDYLGHDGERVAAGVYAGHLVLIALGYGWLWTVVGRRRAECAPRLPAKEFAVTRAYIVASVLLYAAAMGLAWLSAAASVGLTLMLAAFWSWNAYRRFRVDPQEAAFT